MGKKVLIVGSGGREHALAWKLARSSDVARVYVAPGNAGTPQWNVPIQANDISGLVRFAKEEEIDLTVVGPEEPLSLGIVDSFTEQGLRVFGPTKAAAQLESSKAFAKMIMDEAKVPTASWEVFEEAALAKEYVRKIGVPCVLKADGLAAGKGVIVAMDLDTALDAVDEIFDGAFGDAGKKLIIEEYLEGQEVSLLCFCDGKTAYPMTPVQDHKRALDNDQGLNTGGMGTYSPPPVWTTEVEDLVMKEIVDPTLRIMREKGIPFTGVLFVGLMLTNTGPKVLEYNARFGDPETQVIMIRLESDLFSILWACTERKLDTVAVEWSNEKAVCVVMAAPGYPASYKKGIPINVPSLAQNEVVFHAGTTVQNDRLVSSGGRVLGVTAMAPDLVEARQKAYEIVKRISFPEAHFRTDIGLKGL
ncbi:MAG: phosphoribosylamine--glycine ligase [Desulfitobacterium hafniense]|nr:phosphoribosylamine--glycine ligase [Desulfitobacterium hafniense]